MKLTKKVKRETKPLNNYMVQSASLPPVMTTEQYEAAKERGEVRIGKCTGKQQD